MKHNTANATDDEQRRLQVHFRCLVKQHQATKTSVVAGVVDADGVFIVAVFQRGLDDPDPCGSGHLRQSPLFKSTFIRPRTTGVKKYD